MNEQPYFLLEADDCSAFQNQDGHGEAIRYFISKASNINVFHFGNRIANEEIPEIAEFDYRDAAWKAGRLVGEADFVYQGYNYKIKINPRFGTLQLFRMFEEVFNVRFSESKKQLSPDNDYRFLIKKLISFLWLNMLARANSHGLPRHEVNRVYKGAMIKGRMDVRKSVRSLYTEKQVVSTYREKALNETIKSILSQAYMTLLRSYYLGTMSISTNAEDAIEQIKTSGVVDKNITENQFRTINYKDIYLPFKPVVSLSWDIIKKKDIGTGQHHTKKDSFSFFIDVAEIWEMYLRSLLKKHLAMDGWKLRNDKLQAYQNKAFQRTMIPDIVFQRGDEVMVWDAKYKRMRFDYFDYDRVDFFQIHTYVNYYHQSLNVIAGGLLYPFSRRFDAYMQEKNRSETLFSLESTKTKFLVDGIDYSDISTDSGGTQKIAEEELNFVSRISSLSRSSSPSYQE